MLAETDNLEHHAGQLRAPSFLDKQPRAVPDIIPGRADSPTLPARKRGDSLYRHKKSSFGYSNMKVTPLLLVVLPVVALANGCTAKKSTTWTPRPLVQWEELSADSVMFVREGYQIQIPLPTRGIFPAALGITRLAVVTPDHNGQTSAERFTLLTDPTNEFLQWNRTLDDLMAISEVFPLSECDLGGGPAEPEQIVAAFDALHARLGLIYSVNELTRHEVEMFGVLYDTKTATPMASIHAKSQSQEALRNADRNQQVDLWRNDARALVREKFERYVHSCIHELIMQDEMEIVQAPTGWTPIGPLRPVVWPPRFYRPSP